MRKITIPAAMESFAAETGKELKLDGMGRPSSNGSLDLRGTGLTRLPEGLVVDGDLDLRGTRIKKLPNMIVLGNLFLAYNYELQEVGTELIVKGDVIIEFTDLYELPETMNVGGDLFIRQSHIEKLPQNLFVGNNICAPSLGIEVFPEVLIAGGSANLEDCNATEIHTEFMVGGDLFLGASKNLKLVSGKINVLGDLDISHNDALYSIHGDIKVGGNIFAEETPLTKDDFKEAFVGLEFIKLDEEEEEDE